MSKEEFLKVQTIVLKVNIHCGGCRKKVKKIQKKIEVPARMNKEEFLKIQKMRMPLQFMKMMPQGGPANGNFNVGQPSNQNGGGGGGGKQPLALQVDEYDDEFDDEDDYDDCEDDDELDDVPMNKPLPKPGMIGNGIGPPMPSMPKRGPQMPGNGGMNVPVQVSPGGGVGANGGGKKVATGGGNRKKGGSGGANGGGGGGRKDANNGQDINAGIGGLAASMHNMIANGAKKGGETNEGASNGMPNATVAANGGVSQMGSNHPMGQMGNQAGFEGMPPMPGVVVQMAGNPYYQLLAALMMNQKRANGNERFQPMMHVHPPPAVNYMQPYPAYPYRPQANQYTMFNDENTSSCRVM